MKKWSELKEYLLFNIAKADTTKSKANPTFTKEEMWNHYMKLCLAGKNEFISINVVDILIKNVQLDF